MSREANSEELPIPVDRPDDSLSNYTRSTDGDAIAIKMDATHQLYLLTSQFLREPVSI